VTLSDLEQPRGLTTRYFTQHGSFWSQMRQVHWNSATKFRGLDFGNVW